MSEGDKAALQAVERLAASCETVLQSNLVSTILHGSLTQEDFRPGISDLDLLLVVDRALTKSQSDDLIRMVESFDPAPAGGVDLLVVTERAAAVTSFECDPALELSIGRWPGPVEDFEIEGPDAHVSDLWPELSESRANGRALRGAEPGDVIGSVPAAQVRANSLGHLRRWLGLTDDDANAVLMVLTACRMWRFEMTGEHVSKTDAGEWALSQDPSLTAVEAALSMRATAQSVRVASADIEHVLRRVLRDLEGAPRA